MFLLLGTMESSALSADEFLKAAHDFIKISNRIGDAWCLKENAGEPHKAFLKKDTFLNNEHEFGIMKAEFVIFYNLSYGVPSFSFNLWDSSGVLITLEDIRKMSFIRIKGKDFYSVITQQDHPIFQRPYFIVHPCHTSILLSEFKQSSKNIIVTFLGMVTPLIPLDLPLEYGL